MNKLIIAAPFVLVTTLGLHSRTSAEAFRYTAYSEIENREITNYIPIVQAAEQKFGANITVSEAEAGKLADTWIAENASGKLKSLRPIVLSDSSRDGVKAEIVRASTLISDSLNMAAEDRIANKQYFAAANDSLKAAQEAETVKDFDFSSLAICSMTQRRSIQIISDVYPKLTAAQKTQVSRQVGKFYTSDDKLKQLALDTRVLESQRETPGMVTDSDSKKIAAYFSMTPKEANKAIIGTHRAPMVMSDDSVIVDAMNEYRLGFAAAGDTNRVLARFVKHIA